MASNRYYDTGKKGQEIKPGRISQKLRQALNLADNDLPIWIYRMRALGYPPGWLGKAIVDTSDIFDTDQPEDCDTSTTREERKRKVLSNDEIQYDYSKLIEYPGFNVPLPPGTNDYHYYYNMPPMLAHQQLEHAKKFMNPFNPAPVSNKKSRLSSDSPSSSKDQSVNTVTNNSLNLGTDKDPITLEEGKDPASPDIDDGEKKGEEEKAELQDRESKQDEDKQDSFVSDTTGNGNPNVSKSSTGEIKLISKGSPMPKPVSRLPLERFSEGVVGELLYFENTPGSTGKFESIRGLLSTIRSSRQTDV